MSARRVPESHRSRARSGTPSRGFPLAVSMGLAILVVAALAYWDAQRESSAALTDSAEEQATLAKSVSAALSGRAAALGSAALTAKASALFTSVQAIEEPRSVRLLLARPGQGGLATTDDRVVVDAEVTDAISSRRDLGAALA